MLSGFSGRFFESARACSNWAVRSAMVLSPLWVKVGIDELHVTQHLAGLTDEGTHKNGPSHGTHVTRRHRLAAHGQRRQPDVDRRRLADRAWHLVRSAVRARGHQAVEVRALSPE